MTSPMIKIGIPGAAGRMGRMLIREIAAAPDLELVAATDHSESEALGQDSGLLAGTGTNGVLISDNPETLAGADVLIDFTSPAASIAHAGIAAGQGCAMVVGTTGLSGDDEAALAAARAEAAADLQTLRRELELLRQNTQMRQELRDVKAELAQLRAARAEVGKGGGRRRGKRQAAERLAGAERRARKGRSKALPRLRRGQPAGPGTPGLGLGLGLGFG